MDVKYESKRLVMFRKECILAGPRDSIVGFFRFLKELGADVAKTVNSENLVTSRGKIVLLLRNEGKNKLFPQVTVLNRTWWDFYHNPRKHKTKIKTYNLPKQWKQVCESILILENVPLLIPES